MPHRHQHCRSQNAEHLPQLGLFAAEAIPATVDPLLEPDFVLIYSLYYVTMEKNTRYVVSVRSLLLVWAVLVGPTYIALVAFLHSDTGSHSIANYNDFAIVNPIKSKGMAAVVPPAIKRDYSLPPLHTVLSDNKTTITGNVATFLDFATIGFGKCGTTTLNTWFRSHPELQALPSEDYSLITQDPARLVAKLHHRLTAPNKQRGYKCPGDINQHHVLEYYRTLFPRTKLFVGVRHAIRHFESMYNFRVDSLNETIPHPNYLIGACFQTSKMVCTAKSEFAYHLLQLGKKHWNGTRPTTALEQEIVAPYRGRNTGVDPTTVPFLPNPVFLYEISQLDDSNKTRMAQFRRDVQDFLGVSQPMPPLPMIRPGDGLYDDLPTQVVKEALKIDICERQYIPLRRELMRLSRLNAEWMRDTFLQQQDVPITISSPEYFVNTLVQSWDTDPCGPESDAVSDEESMAIFEATQTQFFSHLPPHR